MKKFMPLRLNIPPQVVGRKGRVTPTEAWKKQGGVCSGGMKPLKERIPRFKQSGGRGGFIFSNIHFLLVMLIVLVILVSHTLYVARTAQYPEMDEHLYVDYAVQFYRIFQTPSYDMFSRMNQYLVDHPPFRPPLYSLSITLLLLIFGLDNAYKLGLWVNGIFYATTIIALYFLARHFLSRAASFISCLLFAFYGWTLFYLHFTYSETATTTFLVLSLLFLFKTQNFQNRKHSFLFGTFFALGLFVRWVIPLFLAGPLLFVFCQFLKSKKDKIVTGLKNILISLIPVFFPVLFYLINWKSFGSYFFSQFFSGPLWELVPATRRNFLSYESAVYYLKVFEQLTIVPFLLLIAGFIVCLVNRKKWGILAFSLTISYLLFSFGTIIKDDRYIVPIYPVIALVSATVVDYLRNNKTKTVLIFLLVSLGFMNFFGASWGLGPSRQGLRSFLLKMPIGHPRRIHVSPVVWPPAKEFSNAKEIMKILGSDSKGSNIENPKVFSLFYHHPLSNALYSINKYEKENPFILINLVGSEMKDLKQATSLIESFFDNADYVLFKDKNFTDNYFPSHNYVLIDYLNTKIKEGIYDFDKFYKIAEVAIPIDQSKVLIYRKKF